MKEIFYFILGAAVGAIFALLFAPQSGEELRTKIQTTAEQDWQTLQEQWQASLQKINERLDQLQAELRQATEPGIAEADSGKTA